MKPKHEFIKRNGMYVFKLTTDKFVREETVTKEIAIEQYNITMNQKTILYEQLKKANKDLEINKVEKDDELERFILLANKASSYKRMMDAEATQKNILDMIGKSEQELKDIRAVIPEIDRQKK